MRQSSQSFTKVAAWIAVTAATCAMGQTRREFRFAVGPHSNISVTNRYGAISVKPASGNQVIITALLQSDKVEVDQERTGSRIEVISHLLPGATPENSAWITN